jgi:hypothetical protein
MLDISRLSQAECLEIIKSVANINYHGHQINNREVCSYFRLCNRAIYRIYSKIPEAFKADGFAFTPVYENAIWNPQSILRIALNLENNKIAKQLRLSLFNYVETKTTN